MREGTAAFSRNASRSSKANRSRGFRGFGGFGRFGRFWSAPASPKLGSAATEAEGLAERYGHDTRVQDARRRFRFAARGVEVQRLRHGPPAGWRAERAWLVPASRRQMSPWCASPAASKSRWRRSTRAKADASTRCVPRLPDPRRDGALRVHRRPRFAHGLTTAAAATDPDASACSPPTSRRSAGGGRETATGNKGHEAAVAAIEMADVVAQMTRHARPRT